MRLYRLLLLCCLLLVIVSESTAQDTTALVFNQVYRGKNMYVKNPLRKDSSFCTCNVYINDERQNMNYNAGAYEIDLSTCRMLEELEIRIVHYKDCKVQILNPGFGRPPAAIQYISFVVSEDSVRWSTKQAVKDGKFTLEHFEYNEWEPRSGIPITPESKDSLFKMSLQHFFGENMYRVKYVSEKGEVVYTQIVSYHSTLDPLEIKTNTKEKRVSFSRKTSFVIVNEMGESMIQGNDVGCDYSELKKGIYYVMAEGLVRKLNVK